MVDAARNVVKSEMVRNEADCNTGSVRVATGCGLDTTDLPTHGASVACIQSPAKLCIGKHSIKCHEIFENRKISRFFFSLLLWCIGEPNI